MKKMKFEKKLSLNKETVAKLNADEMSKVKGGEEAALSIIRKWCRTGSGSIVCCPTF